MEAPYGNDGGNPIWEEEDWDAPNIGTHWNILELWDIIGGYVTTSDGAGFCLPSIAIACLPVFLTFVRRESRVLLRWGLKRVAIIHIRKTQENRRCTEPDRNALSPIGARSATSAETGIIIIRYATMACLGIKS